jgi:hypothetical protein
MEEEMGSKDTKRTFFNFLPYECAAAEEYLEQMAEKGWLLQSASGSFLKFKKINPKKIKYQVNLIEPDSYFIADDTDADLKTKEYYENEGWTYICNTGKAEISYTEKSEKTDFIKKGREESFNIACKRYWINSAAQAFGVLLLIFNAYMQIFLLDINQLLSSNFGLAMLLLLFFIIGLSSINITNFTIWFFKARRLFKRNKIVYFSSLKKNRIRKTIVKSYVCAFILLLPGFMFVNTSFERDVLEYNMSLTLGDFGHVVHDGENLYESTERSIIAERKLYYYSDSGTSLFYSGIQSQYPWVIRLSKDRMFSKHKRLNWNYKEESSDLPDYIKVYSGGDGRRFILISDNTIIDIRNNFDGMSNDEFLDIVYRKIFQF